MKLLRSFGYATTGIVTFFRRERNGKIQLLAAIVVAVAGIVLRISLHEWMWVIACTATVLSLEMMNTAIEKFCDLVHPGYHPAIKIIKDIAAGAVLIAAIFSVVVATIIFLPKL